MKRKNSLAIGLAALLSVGLMACGSGPATGLPGGGSHPGGTASCSAPQTGSVDSVAVDDDTVVVSGSVDDGCTTEVEVFALDTSADPGDYASTTAVATVSPAVDGSFEASFDRHDGDTDRLYSQFVAVGSDGTAVARLGEPHFADQLALDPANTSPRFQPTTQKGLSVSMTGDAEELGIGHAAVSVGANYLMKAGPGAPGETISYSSGGSTYYFDKKYVDWLDHTIKPLSDDDVLVYLVMVLIYDDEPNTSFPMLVHPGAPTGAPASFMTYAFNTVTPEGVAAFTALMEFVSERYSRDDQQFGRSVDYIIGNEIDSAGVWQQMGEKTLPDFLDDYAPALRLAWQASQKHYADSRVYTSLDHFWNSTANPADPLRFYKGKDVLDGLAAKVRAGGDFPWNLAYHPYPADMLNPDTWDDPVTDDPSTPKITFKNVAQLPSYLAQPELQFDGQQRHIILSEQGCQSPSNSAVDQERQAACFAYSYYKVLAAGGIDAYIWDPQVDNRAASGLRIGLWTWDDDREDFIAAPGQKKQVYELFKRIDTPDSLALTEFAKPVIGIDDWTDVIPNFDPAMIDSRTTATQAGAIAGGTPTAATALSGFESGVDGWRTADHSNLVESVVLPDAAEGTHALRVHFDDEDIVQSNGTNSKSWRGTDLPLPSALDATATPVLTAQVRIPDGVAAGFDPDNRFSAQLRAYGADGTVAFGTVAVPSADGWSRVSVDLSQWSGRSDIVRIKLWMKGSSGEDWNGTFLVDDVALATGITGATPANLDVTARADDRNGTGSPVAITVTNNGTTALTSDLAVTDCAGVDLADTSLGVDGLAAAGGTTTISSTFAAYAPTDPDFPQFCVVYGSQTIPVTVAVPPPPPTLLYDFEDGAQGWNAIGNVASVSPVTSFPNGPQTPHGGTTSLEAVLADGDASAPKTIGVRPAAPIPLDGATEIYAWVDAYGGIPDATGYEATMTAYSGSESISVVDDDFVPDSWNELSIDISGWAYRSNVTGIDISYKALGTTFNWVGGPRLQVDDVGVEGDFDAQAAWRAAWTSSIGGNFSGDSRSDASYRQPMKLAASGDDVRVRFSNPSAAAISFDAASVGVRDGATAATLSTPIALTQSGSSTITVPPGGTVYTDSVHLPVEAGQELLVSSHASGVIPLLSHDFALKTVYATAAAGGDHTADQVGTAYAAVGTSTYWVDAVDVFSSDVAGTIVALGDSITDGAGSDLDADNRWTNQLADRLLALPVGDPARKSVINAGIGGGTLSSVANAQVGENGLNRFDRDVLGQTGVTDLVVFAGTNDIFVGSTSEQVIHALTLAAQRARDHGLRTIVSTLIPRGNGAGWTSAMEQERLEVNSWVRSQDVFDAVIDNEAAVRDPADPSVILAAYDADGTHPNAAGYAAIAAGIDTAVFTTPITQPGDSVDTLYDFETDAQGWQAGAGVDSVARVGSFPNGPGIPAFGYGALNGALSTASAGLPKSVSVEPSGGLDLSGSSEVYAWVDAYGGLPDATGYAVDITVYSGSDSVTGTNNAFAHDRWNRVAVDVSGWAHLDAVTKIEITYRIVGSTTSWSGAQLQVDEVGVSRTDVPAPQPVSLYDFESGTAGWQAGANVLGVSTVSSFPNGPYLPHGGASALQAVMAEGDVSLPKTISVTPSSPLDLGDASSVGLWFDGYGGVPDATGYSVDVTLWSGTDSVTGTLENYVSDQWSLVSVDIGDWSGRDSIDRIDVTYTVHGSTFSWVGQPLFQIDDVHALV